MSEKHDQEYFGDGMAEEIVNLLVKIPKLKVIGRTSSFQFKGKPDDLRTIGMTLGAAYIVEGSVRMEEGSIRVIAQLARSLDGVALWSGSFDGEMKGSLNTQKSIAQKVMEDLPLAAMDAGPPVSVH